MLRETIIAAFYFVQFAFVPCVKLVNAAECDWRERSQLRASDTDSVDKSGASWPCPGTSTWTQTVRLRIATIRGCSTNSRYIVSANSQSTYTALSHNYYLQVGLLVSRTVRFVAETHHTTHDAVAPHRRCGSIVAKNYEMRPAGVLSIAIRADFWQPQKNERKAELINYWHQRAALDRMNTYIYQKGCTQPCHGHFRAMPKGQNFVVLLLLLLLRYTFYFHAISQELSQIYRHR